MAAGQTPAGDAVHIRSLSSQEDFRQAVELQRIVWGFDEAELLPARLFTVASHIGGQVYGAFDGASEGARMIAFCISLPGVKPGPRPYLHSQMLGVLEEYRDRGVGRALKLRQREDALARGIELIEWTFDPLQIRNAWFNIVRLGAVVRRYVRNVYGSTSSHLHSGLPTDRCVAEWWIARPSPSAKSPVIARVEVPERASVTPEIQARIADAFEAAFARGLLVSGVERRPAGGVYLFTAESSLEA